MSTAALSHPFLPDPCAEALGAAFGRGVDLWLQPLRWAIAWAGAGALTLLMLVSLTPPPSPHAPTATTLAAILTPQAATSTLPQPDTHAEAARPRPGTARHSPGTPRTSPPVLTREDASLAVPADRPQPHTAPPLLNPGTAGVVVDAKVEAGAANAAPPAEPVRPARTTAEESLTQRCPTQVAPAFPRAAQEDDIVQGRVLTRLQLDASGAVAGVEVLSAEPAGYFEAEVRRAALKWRCQATGRTETLRVPFYFRLK